MSTLVPEISRFVIKLKFWDILRKSEEIWDILFANLSHSNTSKGSGKQ